MFRILISKKRMLHSDKPQSVCTCCHCAYMRKLVILYHLSNNDFSDCRVQQALGVQYRIQSRGFAEYIYRSGHNCLRSDVTLGPRKPQNAFCKIFKILALPNNF